MLRHLHVRKIIMNHPIYRLRYSSSFKRSSELTAEGETIVANPVFVIDVYYLQQGIGVNCYFPSIHPTKLKKKSTIFSHFPIFYWKIDKTRKIDA